MNPYDAAEQSYKNGYEQGKKDALTSLLSDIEKLENQAFTNTQRPSLNNTYYSGKYSAYHKVVELIRRKEKQ